MTDIRSYAVQAFDPIAMPELFDGVRHRRFLAFLIDLVILSALTIFFGMAIFVLGILTFGLGWALYAILLPMLGTLYVAFTVGSGDATWGMRAMGLTMRLWHGGKVGFLIGFVHAFLFWFSLGALWFLIWLPPLFDSRRRMLHDFPLGTLVMDQDALFRRFR